MREKNTGGPAFPVFIVAQGVDPREIKEACKNAVGLTLRDHFAAKALPPIYAEALRDGDVIGFGKNWMDFVARDAFAMADAMLKARDA